MKIISELPKMEKKQIKGAVSIRFVYGRGVYQLYCGGRYVLGCSGETQEDCLDYFDRHYIHVKG